MMNALFAQSVFGTWFFRISILFAGLGCFVGFADHTQHRWEVSRHGIPATIQLASHTQTLPTSWSGQDGEQKSEFYVNIQPAYSVAFKRDLYLPKAVIESLLRGETQKIIYARDNPDNFMMQGDPYPPFGFKLIMLGIALLMFFAYLMRVYASTRYVNADLA